MSEILRSPKLRPWHLDRVAVVYVRQSTPQQVLDHRESTARPYALADRAVALGWPRDRVVTSDDDLGQSGPSTEGRPGFQRRLAGVARDRVGRILGRERSRLARSCQDWHQLPELCGRYRVLLADADGVYDPADHSDRLLRGLHGVMNEAQLHVLKPRMDPGKRSAARRGERLRTPPIRYIRVPAGERAIDPDEQVPAVVRRIFDPFDRAAPRAAVEPAARAASRAAVAGVERPRAERARPWHLRRERAAFEVDRAARPYRACDPENRLVARERERRWEGARKAPRPLDDEYGRFVRSAPAALSDAAVSAIRDLAADRPAVWSAPTTTPADRPRIARRLLDRAVVTVQKGSERVDVALHWVGGAVRLHTLARAVRRYDPHSGYPRLAARLRELCGERRTAAAIADRLNAEGFHPPKRTVRFTRDTVRRLIGPLGLGCRPPHGSPTGLGPDEYRPAGLARRLGINRDTVRRWVRVGWVHVRRDENGIM